MKKVFLMCKCSFLYSDLTKKLITILFIIFFFNYVNHSSIHFENNCLGHNDLINVDNQINVHTEEFVNKYIKTSSPFKGNKTQQKSVNSCIGCNLLASSENHFNPPSNAVLRNTFTNKYKTKLIYKILPYKYQFELSLIFVRGPPKFIIL